MPRILFFIFIFLYCNNALAQPNSTSPVITIQESQITVGKLLKEITTQTEVYFSFNSKVIDKEKIISFEVENATLEETLNLLSEKINVEYLIIEGQVVFNFSKKNNKNSDQYFNLSGFLSDQSSGESLISATVAIKGTSQGTVTNEFGYYNLPLQTGKYILQYSYLGFETIEVEIEMSESLQKNISLPIATTDLTEIEVGIPIEEILNKKQLGAMEISPSKLNNLPEFGGESGIVKNLQSLPGIKMHSDGSAFFYTRGGERDQNLIIIDDAPIYNPSHFFGFYSMVVPDFTKSITVYKNDIPTSLGDRLSSIISIRTKDGNLNKVEFSGALNPLINRFTLETPIVKKKSSIFLSFRRSNFEWLYQRNGNNKNTDFHFQDFHFKWNWKINDKNRLFFTTITSADFLENVEQNRAGLRLGNLAATLRWNHIFGNKLFSNTTLYTGNFATRLKFPPNFWKSDLGMLSLKSDFTHYVSSNYKAKFGIEFQRYYNTPGQVSLDTTISYLPNITSNFSRKRVLYYQGYYDLNNKIKLSGGLRFMSWANLGPKTFYRFDENFEVSDTINATDGIYQRYNRLDPRISIQYKLDPSTQLKLSLERYHQFLQYISNSTSPFNALELWLTSSPNIKPQASTQFALSYLKFFEKSNTELSVATYLKKSKNIIDYEGHSKTYLNELLEGELRFGTSNSYGIELLLKKNLGRLNGWIGYTYSRVFRKTTGLNNNETYRAFQDRPHDFSASLNYQLKRRIALSAYWTSFSGATFSSPIGFYSFNQQTVPIYGERNNDRLPTYNRLDLALKFILNKKETNRFQHSLTFSIYNALAHQNIFAVKFNKLEKEGFTPNVPFNVLNDNNLSPSQIDLIRFFPSLTYKFKI